MRQSTTFRHWAALIAGISLIGPLMVLLGALLGGDVLDGFGGSAPDNTGPQNFLISGGLWIALIGAGIGVVVGLVVWRRRRVGAQKVRRQGLEPRTR